MNTRHLRLILFVFLVGILSTGGCENGSGVAGNNARLLPAPNIEAPLVRILELDTDVPTRVRVEITEGTDMWTHEYSQFDTFHLLPVLRFRAGKEHSVLVQTIDQQGNLNSESLLTVLADPLPQDFPVYSVSANPDMMEPGVTLFAVGSYLVAMDEVGEVVWFYRIQRLSSLDRDVRRMSNGNLLLLLPPQNMNEIDMLGNVVRSWHAAGTSDGSEGSIPVDVLGFHHEVFEMQNGNLLTLSFELRQLENYPSSVIDPLAPLETANVVGDVIVEFDPSGEIINEWSLLDVLDPYRLGYTSLQGIYDTFFEENLGVEPPTRDWSHGNGVIHDPRDDSFIVSLRHQDAVIKIDRQTGALKWILGPHANWDLLLFGDFLLQPLLNDDLFFQYHQHAPMITEQGNILLFDNGNFRASPFDPPREELIFSRAVEYSIDEEQKLVDIVWESTGFAGGAIFAGFLGDADELPLTGNVLATFGGHDPAYIIELTKTVPAQEVFRLTVPVDLITNRFIYRAERLPSLYP